MQLVKKQNSRMEIVHFYDENKTVSSKFNVVYLQEKGHTRTIKLPEKFIYKLFGRIRLVRRALRLDKCNVIPVGENLVIVRGGAVYLYEYKSDTLTKTLSLRNCRVVLHQSIAKNADGYLYFGEYGANPNRGSVPVYRSIDSGKSWEVIYEFEPKTVKHVHGCYYDKYTDKIWVCTGDFPGESWILIANKDFTEIEKIGDGQQRYRACHLIFKEHAVHWIMDSQLEPSHHISYDRQTGEIAKKTMFKGPVYYCKELEDNIYIAATVQEIGEGVLDEKVHVLVSKDLETWTEVATFDHDGWPKRYFKWGVVGFADGKQSSSDFYMFFEALSGVDGKAIKYKLLH